MMHKKFQMSSMGELTFFLGLQVKQKEDGIFISQDKYVTEIMKKFGFSDVKTASTPIETHKPLLKDADSKDIDEHIFQVNPKVSHLHAVKRIFRYLKGQPKLSLWYPKDSPFDLVAYTESDYAGASLDRKSTTGDLLTKAFDKGIRVNAGDSKLMLLGINLLLLGKVNAARHNLLLLVAKMVNREVQLQALVDGKKIVVTEASVRRDLQLEDANGVDYLPNATIFEQLTLMGDNLADEAVNEENVSKHSNDPLLSGEDRLKLKELMALYEGLGKEDASKQGRKIHDINADEDITLENVHDEDMFDIGVFNDEKVFAGQDMAEKEVSIADPVTTAELKSARPKTKWVIMQEPSETTTTTPSKDKVKGIMVEEPLKMKKKDQVLFDEQEAIRLQAQFNEEERIAREKEEANAAFIAQ
ncbi:putative ribonuclease H-like domain-containing protein [Tanacetum coccineum]